MTLGDGKTSHGISPARNAKGRVLVLCGEPRVLAEVKMELRDNFEVSIAATRDAALAALNSHGAGAIVLCIGEESGKAFSLFADISAHSGGAPILFLAEKDDEADEAAAFKMGAADYAVKRRGGGALAARIRLRIGESENKSESEYEKRGSSGEGGVPPVNAESPEAMLAGKTLLIAEDIVLNQQIIAAMLSGIEGLTVEFVSNGKEAVEQFEKNSGLYSLIFMDVHMPEMDGLSAARAIRRLDCENAREIPIIALTASNAEDETAECIQAGMNGYLEKPMDYEKFLSICAEYSCSIHVHHSTGCTRLNKLTEPPCNGKA